jgi:hypothetical protein
MHGYVTSDVWDIRFAVMKPTITLMLTHKVTDNAGRVTEITAVFEGKLPTNTIPDLGHTLWLDVWEDGHPYDLNVKNIRHELKGQGLHQEVVVEAELETGYSAPDDGTLQDLVNEELRVIKADIAPRLLKQGFRMVIEPNTDGNVGHEKPKRAKKAKLPPGTIDCTLKPFVPDDFTIVTHDTSLEQLKWDKQEFSDCLYQTHGQKRSTQTWRFIHVCEIHGELLSYDAQVLNANVLDYLFENPNEIPDAWKEQTFVHFFGTIIISKGGGKCVPALKQEKKDVWTRTLVSLHQGFNGISVPAAVTPKFIKMELDKYPSNQWGLRDW